ncbi:MAG: alpha/beta fold hydrolase [Reyranella sp.]|nr:alpha/beta fold hydrolase [Reyranella sp.]
MTTTVYFATNRTVNHPQDRPSSYTFNIVSPVKPEAVTYGTAFVDSANLTADTVGAIKSIQDIQEGGFSQTAIDDLSAGGRNILVFIHGFANSFENAITRAAFNREWLAESEVADADTAVVAFSWPSRGHVLEPPFPSFAYRWDQTTAGQSGFHLMSFFANLLPILEAARAQGRRTFLLAHSMGNWALQSAVETWFAHGNGDADLFDEALLAAPDEMDTTFDFGPFGRLSALGRLARRISIFHNRGDKVLDVLSETLNGSRRLGQDGPRGQGDIGKFPPATYRMVDCSGFTDYVADFQGSHQYYRRSAGVRAALATVMAS